LTRDQTADVLRGFGILAVVAGHAGSNLGIQVLPVYSYHMPLFFFISGLFFQDTKNERPKAVLTKLVTRLLIPALIANVAYNYIAIRIFHQVGVPFDGPGFSLRAFILAFTFGGVFSAAYWFIGAYILIYLYFSLIHRALHTAFSVVIGNTTALRLLFLGVYLALSATSVYLATSLYGETADADRQSIVMQHRPWIVVLRFFFACFFYYLGSLFTQYRPQMSVPRSATLLIVGVLFTVQGIIFYNANVFFSMQIMSFPNPITPIITSLIGICLFYALSASIIGSDLAKIMSFLGMNSFAILLNHMFGFFLLNLLLVALGFIHLGEISSAYFRFREYYMYPVYIAFGLGVSIVIPVLLAKMFPKEDARAQT